MDRTPPFVDIHCHLLPGLDDGAKSWEESLAMAAMAAEDGVGTVVATPHQLGAYAHIDADNIRRNASRLQQQLSERGITVELVPGADVRIDEALLPRLRQGQVLTLADRRKHVLLELPHELYFPIAGVLDGLRAAGLVGVLSHPERNQGLLKQPQTTAALVDSGCLMQVTAGSLTGAFGSASREMAEWMLEEGLVHFLATDAHGLRSRRPLLRRAFERAAQLAGEETAVDLCCRNPAAVIAGQEVPTTRRRQKKRTMASWFHWRKAA